MLVDYQCEDGGIGRRTGFRIQRFNRGGSTPPPRTSNLVEAPGKGKIGKERLRLVKLKDKPP